MHVDICTYYIRKKIPYIILLKATDQYYDIDIGCVKIHVKLYRVCKQK